MRPPRSARFSALAALVALGVLAHAVPGRAMTYPTVTTTLGLVSTVSAANANPGPDVINMAPGIYTPLTDLTVSDALTVNGGGWPGTYIVGRGGSSYVFVVDGYFTLATFNNLTIQEGGNAGIDYRGGLSTSLRVNRCTITNISGGAGIVVQGGPGAIVNSTITRCYIGIDIESGGSVPLLLENDTIFFNYGLGIRKSGSNLTVRNSIIMNCSGYPNFADHNICFDGSCGPGFTTADPLVDFLYDNGGPTMTAALSDGSPAIDAGGWYQLIDQRGVPRPQGAASDIGAFEWTPFEFEGSTAVVPPGGSVTTDPEGDGATPTDPVETTVTAPNGGTITIEEGPAAADFGFIGQRVHIDASPAATPASPFVIVFQIDASVIPAGQSAATIVVTKNGVVVPDCGSPGTASPDPCVQNRQTLIDGDAQITVLSSTGSDWDFAPEGVTPVLLSLVSAEARDGRVQLDWFSSDGAALGASLYRRMENSDWQLLGSVRADGSGHLRYEDRAVTGGMRYAYRLGYLEQGLERFSSETWVEVPALKFALEGLRPNPAVGELVASFSLPGGEPARLQLFDVTGRVRLTREVGSLGAGNHLVRLSGAASLPSGTYWLRLTQGGRSLLARGVVVR